MWLRESGAQVWPYVQLANDDPKKFTREWFAWQNTLFGELIIKLVNDGKLELLNSIE